MKFISKLLNFYRPDVSGEETSQDIGKLQEQVKFLKLELEKKQKKEQDVKVEH